MELALQSAMLLIIGWLPGAALLRAPVLDRDRRGALDAEERVFWAVILSVACSVAMVLALGALGRYTFERLVAANLLVAAACVILWRGTLRMPTAKPVTAAALVPLLLTALGAWRFFPPAEYVIGGKDPGVYLNEGIQIAQRGSLVVRDDVVASVPVFARGLFMPRYTDFEGNPRTDYYSSRFMGFFIKDPDAGTVIGQFPHAFPASIAIGYGIDGLTGARRTTGVWGILGLLAVYFTGRRLLGTAAAATAAAMLALHVITAWFARYPNAEIAMLALLFAALLANARAHVDGIRFFAPLAGGLLGLLLFLRLDAMLFIGAVVAAGWLGACQGRSMQRPFWAVLLSAAMLAAAYMYGPMRAYWDLYRIFLTNLAWWQYAAVLLAAGLAIVLPTAASRSPRTVGLIRAHTPTLVAALFAAAAVYALFLRQPGGRLAAHDADALRTFANVYFTVPGVLAAVLGFWLLARRRFWEDPAFFVTVAIFSMSVFYKLRIVPEHFWMARRFLPVILPGGLLLVCGAAFASSGSGRWAKVIRAGLGGTLIVLLGAAYLRASRPVLAHTEYEGLIPQMERLASRFGDQDLVIVESRDAGGDVHVLATPLAYVYAKQVLLLYSPRPDKGTLAAFVAWARRHYQRVFFVGAGGTDVLSHAYGLRPVAAERFQVPEFETTTGRLPRVAARKDFEFGVYEFGDASEDDEDAAFDLDIGSGDDLHVLRFHGKERTDGRTFRWTRASSYVAVTTVAGSARQLLLLLNDGGRPAAAPPARVEVYLQGERLGAIDVRAGGFQSYALPLTADRAARAAAATNPVELRLATTTWNPQAVLGTADDRDLGVMLDRVTIK